MSIYIFPVLLLFLIVYCVVKKVSPYKAFMNGAKDAVGLAVKVLPSLVAIFLAIEMMKVSGLGVMLAHLLAPVLKVIGIPEELSLLVFIKPFSGSSCLAILSDIYTQYGVDSYISRAASVIMGASDTLFYIVAIYFTNTKVKKFLMAIPIALLANIVGAIMACLLCRII